MTNAIKAPEIYIKNITISGSTAEQLIAEGLLFPLVMKCSDSKVIQSKLYIENPASHQDQFPPESSSFQMLHSLKAHLALVRKSFDLFPTPQERMYGRETKYCIDNSGLDGNVGRPLSTSQDEFHESSKVLYVLSTIASGSSSIGIMNTENCFEPLIDLHQVKLPMAILSKMVQRNSKKAPTTFFPKTAFRYLSELGGQQSIEVIRDRIATLPQVEPTALAHLLLMPESYYDSPQGVETIIRNLVHSIEPVRSSDQLLGIIQSCMVDCRRDRSLRMIQNALPRLESIRNHTKLHARELDFHLKNELNVIEGTTAAYRVYHYERILIDLVISKSHGLIKSMPSHWAVSADPKMTPDLVNGIFESLLPEVHSASANKNPLARLTYVAALISNVSVQKISPADVFPILGTSRRQEITHDERDFKSPSNPKMMAPTIHFHRVLIDDEPVFKGFFEGIPSVDQAKFKEHMQKMIMTEHAAKLSGAQFKLPVSLTIERQLP